MSFKVVIVIVLFAAAVSGAVALALIEGGVEYRTIGQLTAADYEGERVKVMAQVRGMHQSSKPARFTVTDIPAEGEQLAADAPYMLVIYDGDDLPQGLKQGAHVTMEGGYDPVMGAFVATLLQTQCPSRYEGQQLTTAEEAPAP